jgi:hypothetical protein
VCALEAYTARVANERDTERPGPGKAPADRLFVSQHRLGAAQKRPTVVAATLRNWLKRLFSQARVPTGVGPHAIRAFAASRAFDQGVSLDAVRTTGRWSTESVPIQYYLRTLRGADVASDIIVPLAQVVRLDSEVEVPHVDAGTDD